MYISPQLSVTETPAAVTIRPVLDDLDGLWVRQAHPINEPSICLGVQLGRAFNARFHLNLDLCTTRYLGSAPSPHKSQATLTLWESSQIMPEFQNGVDLMRDDDPLGGQWGTGEDFLFGQHQDTD